MVDECAFHLKVAHGIASGVEVEQSVESHRIFRAHERAFGSVELQSAASAYSNYFKATCLILLHACVEVDVGKSVKLVHHYVDVVAPYACRHHRDALALKLSGHGAEFAALYLTLYVAQMRCHKSHTSRVAYQYHLVCQMFRFQVQMENAAVAVDYQLRSSKILLLHN